MTSPQTPKDVAHPPRIWRYKDVMNHAHYSEAREVLLDSEEYLSLKEHEETVSTLLEALKDFKCDCSMTLEFRGLSGHYDGCYGAIVDAAIAKAEK